MGSVAADRGDGHFRVFGVSAVPRRVAMRIQSYQAIDGWELFDLVAKRADSHLVSAIEAVNARDYKKSGELQLVAEECRVFMALIREMTNEGTASE